MGHAHPAAIMKKSALSFQVHVFVSSPCLQDVSQEQNGVPWNALLATSQDGEGAPQCLPCFTFLPASPIPTGTVLPMSLGTATPVCYLFLIVALVCISLITEWTVAMFLFLIGCCVFFLEGCDLKTIAHF